MIDDFPSPVLRFTAIEDLSLIRGPHHLALGVFDGVHLGHQEVIGKALAAREREGGTCGVLTFDPYPIRVLAPEKAPRRLLASLDHKAEILGRMGVEDRARVVARDATRLGRNPEAPFTLVFLDPPYGRSLGEKAAAAALAGGWVAPGGLLVWEEGVNHASPPGLTRLDQRRYGDTMIAIYRSTVPLPRPDV